MAVVILWLMWLLLPGFTSKFKQRMNLNKNALELRFRLLSMY